MTVHCRKCDNTAGDVRVLRGSNSGGIKWTAYRCEDCGGVGGVVHYEHYRPAALVEDGDPHFQYYGIIESFDHDEWQELQKGVAADG